MRVSSCLILLCVMAATWLAAAGCGDAKCDACPTNPETQANTCSIWEGQYFGEMTGGTASCGDASQLLSGSIRVEVSGIQSVETDPPETLINVTLNDVRDNWTLFSGRICDTADTKSPRSFPFTAFFSQVDTERGYQVYNQLSGNFTEAEMDQPRYLTANYSISFTDQNDSNNNCSMQASLRAQ